MKIPPHLELGIVFIFFGFSWSLMKLLFYLELDEAPVLPRFDEASVLRGVWWKSVLPGVEWNFRLTRRLMKFPPYPDIDEVFVLLGALWILAYLALDEVSVLPGVWWNCCLKKKNRALKKFSFYLELERIFFLPGIWQSIYLTRNLIQICLTWSLTKFLSYVELEVVCVFTWRLMKFSPRLELDDIFVLSGACRGLRLTRSLINVFILHGAWWNVCFTWTLTRFSSHNSMFPQSLPDRTLPSGNSM